MEYARITLPAAVSALDEAQAFVEGQAEQNGFSPAALFSLRLATEELFVNIAQYAYENGGQITLEFCMEGAVARLAFIDSGKPFNPLQKKEPNLTLSAEERQPGGLGIFLVRKHMDALEYRREEGQNIFTVKKNREG